MGQWRNWGKDLRMAGPSSLAELRGEGIDGMKWATSDPKRHAAECNAEWILDSAVSGQRVPQMCTSRSQRSRKRAGQSHWLHASQDSDAGSSLDKQGGFNPITEVKACSYPFP